MFLFFVCVRLFLLLTNSFKLALVFLPQRRAWSGFPFERGTPKFPPKKRRLRSFELSHKMRQNVKNVAPKRIVVVV